MDSLAGLLIDGMHVLDEGLTKRFCAGAIALLSASLGPQDGSRLTRDLNEMLRHCKLFPGPRGHCRLHPKALFYYSKEGAQMLSHFTAAEMAASVPVLPFVFAAHPLLSKLFCVWAELYNELRSPRPGWEGARSAYRLYQELLRAYAASGLDAALKEGINTPKAHDIVHLIGQRLALGAIDQHNLQQMENAHIVWLKSAFKKTDKRTEGFEACMAAAVVDMQTKRLLRQMLGRHFAAETGLCEELRAKWRQHAGVANVDSAVLRGRGRRADMPASLKLGRLCARSLASPVGDVGLEELQSLIQAALELEADGATLAATFRDVSSTHAVVTYTACKVVGAGCQQCVKAWAYARPESGGSSKPLFDFVAFAAVDDDTHAVVESVGMLLLVFTLQSVREPLCLLKMLRRQPPRVAV
jgi:hypothetical protein